MKTACNLPELNVGIAVKTVIKSCNDIWICMVLKFTD